jgi:hypothetical protein
MLLARRGSSHGFAECDFMVLATHTASGKGIRQQLAARKLQATFTEIISRVRFLKIQEVSRQTLR